MRTRPDMERIERLPKYAQEYIRSLENNITRLEQLVNKLDARQDDDKPDWHDWEFREIVMDTEIRQRYINASEIELDCYGIIVRLSPNGTRKEVRVSWDTGKGFDWSHDVALLPSAANALNLKLMKRVDV